MASARAADGTGASGGGAGSRLVRLAVVAAAYCGLSALIFGRHVLGDPSHLCACIGGAGDPPSYMWDLAWWPHALTHATNPFFTHVVWSPVGGNVAAAAMIPLPSMLAWPLTALFGVLPTYDVIAILSPAAAATSMYALCRHVTARALPSLAGGWIFGFSSYELSQRVGHVNLMLIALLPLIVLTALARLERRLGRRAFVAAMALLIFAQLLTSSELLATGLAFGALALVLAWLTSPPAKRAELVATALEIAVAGILAALITSPYLYWAAIRSHPEPVPEAANALVVDLANLVVPTPVTLVRYASGTAASLPGNVAEQGGYLSVPLVAAFVLAMWSRRRTPAAIILATSAAVALLLSFGAHLKVAGHPSIPLPWALISHLPVAKAAVPDRMVLYVWLALALAIALWLGTPARRPTTLAARWALVLAGIVLILPDGASPLFNSIPTRPALFATNAYKRLIHKGSNVLILPYAYRGYSMLWQAEANFAFNMPEGNLSGVAPIQFRRDPMALKLLSFPPQPVSPPELSAFLARYHVATVVVEASDPETWPAELQALGFKASQADGVIIYRV